MQLDEDQNELRAFVGPNADYYLPGWWAKKWKWNWAAFFFGGWWIAYRKMYKAFVIFFGIILTETSIELVFFPNLAELIGRATYVVYAIVCGAFGNTWYYRKAKAVIADAHSHGGHPQWDPAGGPDVYGELRKRGGTSVLIAIVALALAFVIAFATLMVLAGVVDPAQLD